jgi:protein TonB
MDAPLPRPRPDLSDAPKEKTAEKKIEKPVRRAARKAPERPRPVEPAAPPPVSPFFSLGGPATAASIEQPVGRGSNGGNAGSGGTSPDARGRASVSSYQAKATAHLLRYRSYPQEARRQGIRGTVQLAFTVNAGGRVVGVSLTRSSGSATLDNAALAMVRRASPFPPLPPGLGSSTTIRAPIRFSIGR